MSFDFASRTRTTSRLSPPQAEPATISNPYQSPDAVSPAPQRINNPVATRWWFAWRLAYFYPIWLVGSFYSVWIVAWASLGHPPRPNLDDPTDIGGLMDWVYYLPGVLCVCLPVLAPLGFVAALFPPKRSNDTDRTTRGIANALIYLVMCACAVTVLRQDPLDAIAWWFD